MSYTSSSFYLDADNVEYINEQIKDKKRYNKSNWLNDLIDHLRLQAESKISIPAGNALIVGVKEKKPVKRFVPPTVEEVKEYCDSRCNNVNAQNFVDHYTGNGWVRGKTKVKCWKACVRTWEQNDKARQQGNKQFSDVTNQNINNIGEWLNE